MDSIREPEPFDHSFERDVVILDEPACIELRRQHSLESLLGHNQMSRRISSYFYGVMRE